MSSMEVHTQTAHQATEQTEQKDAMVYPADVITAIYEAFPSFTSSASLSQAPSPFPSPPRPILKRRSSCGQADLRNSPAKSQCTEQRSRSQSPAASHVSHASHASHASVHSVTFSDTLAIDMETGEFVPPAGRSREEFVAEVQSRKAQMLLEKFRSSDLEASGRGRNGKTKSKSETKTKTKTKSESKADDAGNVDDSNFKFDDLFDDSVFTFDAGNVDDSTPMFDDSNSMFDDWNFMFNDSNFMIDAEEEEYGDDLWEDESRQGCGTDSDSDSNGENPNDDDNGNWDNNAAKLYWKGEDDGRSSRMGEREETTVEVVEVQANDDDDVFGLEDNDFMIVFEDEGEGGQGENADDGWGEDDVEDDGSSSDEDEDEDDDEDMDEDMDPEGGCKLDSGLQDD